MTETKNMQDLTPFDSLEHNNDTNGSSRNTKIGIGAGVIVGIVALILALVFLLKHPATTATIRDLFIIVLALETFIIGTLLVILIWQLIVLIRMLRDDLKPMIKSTQETVNTVKGTATFVSKRVTKPAIAASSYAVGIARSISTLGQMLPRRRSSGETASGPTETGDEK